MTTETEERYQEKKSNNIILPIILGLLLLGIGIWAFMLQGKNSTLQTEKTALSSEMVKLQDVKVQLKASVDSLESAYHDLSDENTSLQGDVEEAKRKAKNAGRSSAKWKRKLQEANDSNASLSAQIQALLAAKGDLESSIVSLQMQNDSLMSLTESLSQDLVQSREDKEALKRLNASINDELKRLTLANFQATAFNVSTLQRNGKLNARARRVKKIKVSFDLTNVPEKYQGVRPVYMVITDEKATPIKVDNVINATVKVNGQSLDIQAVEAKEINISDSQRLAFSHDLLKKLKRGYYRVAVYTDIGMLGGSSFRLR